MWGQITQAVIIVGSAIFTAGLMAAGIILFAGERLLRLAGWKHDERQLQRTTT